MKTALTRLFACAAFALALAAFAPVMAIAAETYDDQSLAQTVSDELRSAGYALDVESKDGHITLTGKVPTNNDLPLAENKARQVKGVRSVNTFNLEYEDYMGEPGPANN